uniref:C3H1-type domain-containing protein n=1 Tax=Eptatretus burgeri TaxID=7764 RepID=A0A8C4N241_EPTBU
MIFGLKPKIKSKLFYGCCIVFLIPLPCDLCLCLFVLDCCSRDFPCRFFHVSGKCFQGDNCKFSHDALNDDAKEMLQKVLDSEAEAYAEDEKEVEELKKLGITPLPKPPPGIGLLPTPTGPSGYSSGGHHHPPPPHSSPGQRGSHMGPPPSNMGGTGPTGSADGTEGPDCSAEDFDHAEGPDVPPGPPPGPGGCIDRGKKIPSLFEIVVKPTAQLAQKMGVRPGFQGSGPPPPPFPGSDSPMHPPFGPDHMGMHASGQEGMCPGEEMMGYDDTDCMTGDNDMMGHDMMGHDMMGHEMMGPEMMGPPPGMPMMNPMQNMNPMGPPPMCAPMGPPPMGPPPPMMPPPIDMMTGGPPSLPPPPLPPPVIPMPGQLPGPAASVANVASILETLLALQGKANEDGSCLDFNLEQGLTDTNLSRLFDIMGPSGGEGEGRETSGQDGAGADGTGPESSQNERAVRAPDFLPAAQRALFLRIKQREEEREEARKSNRAEGKENEDEGLCLQNTYDS